MGKCSASCCEAPPSSSRDHDGLRRGALKDVEDVGGRDSPGAVSRLTRCVVSESSEREYQMLWTSTPLEALTRPHVPTHPPTHASKTNTWTDGPRSAIKKDSNNPQNPCCGHRDPHCRRRHHHHHQPRPQTLKPESLKPSNLWQSCQGRDDTAWTTELCFLGCVAASSAGPECAHSGLR